MKCLHCGKKLPMVKKLTSEEFCTVAHRQAYFAEQEKLAIARLIEEQQRQRPSRKPLPRGRVTTELETPLVADFLGEAPGQRTLPLSLWLLDQSLRFDSPLVLPGLELRLQGARNQLAGVQLQAVGEISGEQNVAAAMAALNTGTALSPMAPQMPAIEASVRYPAATAAEELQLECPPPVSAQHPESLVFDPSPVSGPLAAFLPVVQLEPMADELGSLDLIAEGHSPLPLDLSRRLKPSALPEKSRLEPFAAIHFRVDYLRYGSIPASQAALPAAASAGWSMEAIPAEGDLSLSQAPPRQMDSHLRTRKPASSEPSHHARLPFAGEPAFLGFPEYSRPGELPPLPAASPFLPALKPEAPMAVPDSPDLQPLTSLLARLSARPVVRLPRPPQLEAFAGVLLTSRHLRQPASTGGPELVLQRPAGKCQPYSEMASHPVEFLRAVEIPLRESRFQFGDPIAPRARIASVRRSTLGVTARTYRNSKLQRLSIHPDSGSRAPKAHPWKPWANKLVALPKLRLATVPVKAGHSLLAGLSPFTGIGHQFAWESLKRRWQETPNDLRWVALAVPLVIGLLWLSGSKTAQASLRAAVPDVSGLTKISLGEDSLSSLKQNIQRRAAVELVDDFRQGLGEWAGSGDWSRGWSYDPAGFIRPRKLALYTPTLALEDYRLEFLGAIERKALSWVFRAADVNNYYAARLEVTRGGPLPAVELVRWAVINGRPGPRKAVALPMQTRLDTIYRVRVDVRGNDFVTTVQGQVVDVFSDNRLPRGGVGFFSEPGEDARLRWVEVSHQYDMLGRLCAYLVPYNDSNSNVRSAP